jgi:hypothetical protein
MINMSTEIRELKDDELAAASGGNFLIPIRDLSEAAPIPHADVSPFEHQNHGRHEQ